MTDLERLLNPEQLQEIKESLTNPFKQMPPPLWKENSSITEKEKANPEGRTRSPEEEAHLGVNKMIPK